MFGLPEGRGLMAFSDTAGANACLSLAFMLKAENQLIPSLYTNNPVLVTNDWALEVNYVESYEDIAGQRGDYVFTGTSHPDSSKRFELGFIRWAKQLEIPSISFIDHWVNFRTRFEINDELLLPDKIWVLDKNAKESAIAEGLPVEKLVIHANPQHQYLANYWKSQFEERGYLRQLGITITPGTKVVLYAPDPLSLRGKNQELGFDEVSVLSELLNALSEIPDQPPLLVIIKAHPLQPEGKLENAIGLTSHSNIRCEIVKKAKNAELINCADIVIGIYSNFILEAKQMHKPVVRYFPAPQALDPLNHLEDLKPVTDQKTLFGSLNTYV